MAFYLFEPSLLGAQMAWTMSKSGEPGTALIQLRAWALGLFSSSGAWPKSTNGFGSSVFDPCCMSDPEGQSLIASTSQAFRASG